MFACCKPARVDDAIDTSSKPARQTMTKSSPETPTTMVSVPAKTVPSEAPVKTVASQAEAQVTKTVAPEARTESATPARLSSVRRSRNFVVTKPKSKSLRPSTTKIDSNLRKDSCKPVPATAEQSILPQRSAATGATPATQSTLAAAAPAPKPAKATTPAGILDAALSRATANLEVLETMPKTKDLPRSSAANVVVMMAAATKRVMHPNISYGWWIIALMLLFFALMETDNVGEVSHTFLLQQHFWYESINEKWHHLYQD